MEKLKTHAKKIITWHTFWQMLKYGLITIASYLFIVITVFILKNYLGMDQKIAYAIALTIAYIGVYIGYNKFVFQTVHSNQVLQRFLIVLALSWFGNNLLFAVWVDYLSIHYAIATILNTLVLGVLRFLAQKYYVHE